MTLDPTLKRLRVQTPLDKGTALVLIAKYAPELSPVAHRKLLAQALFETADFQCCWCNNWGNIRPEQGAPYYTVRCNERKADGTIVWLDDSPFKVYPNHDEGCKQWLKKLSQWTHAWTLVQDDSATVEAFVKALEEPPPGKPKWYKYYTDDPEHYSKGVRQKLDSLWMWERQLRLIKLGDVGSIVSRWQELMGVNVTGKFDMPTHLATTAFQRSHGLKGDGKVGHNTWEAALDAQ